MIPIIIVMTTYFPDYDREYVAEQAAQSWHNNFMYEGLMYLYISDDGTPYHWRLKNSWWKNVSYSQQNRHGVGASLNSGFRKAFEISPLVLYMVDDWSLEQLFNLTPWAKLLIECEDVGVVRLGPPHPGISGTVEIFTQDWQGWGLRLNRSGYAFGHRPALYHRRMLDYYGWFKEDCSAIECERDYNERFCGAVGGPDVVYALYHPWKHLDSVSLSELEPK